MLKKLQQIGVKKLKYICRNCEGKFSQDESGEVVCPDCGSHLVLVCSKKDNIKPDHYQGQIEVIDYIQDKLSKEAFEGFCIGNVIKYVSRYKKKNGLEDLRKAHKYLDYIFKED